MSKTAQARAFFTDVEVLTTVENTYRPALNGTRRRITRLGKTFFDATLLDDTSDGRQKAGSECRGHIPARASEVLDISDSEATFRLGAPGTPLYEHCVTYRIRATGADMDATVAALSQEQLAREVSFAAAALDVKDPASCRWLACLLTRLAEQLSGTPTGLHGIFVEIKQALEGDSNDAEHDALVTVAAHLGIDWTPPEG